MAAIEPKTGVLLAALALMFAMPLDGDRAADARAQISHIATALTSGDPADAMTPFDKSFPDYQKLSDYFQGLSASQIENEVDVLDEDDTEAETKLTVNWTLTLTDRATSATERRSAEINVRLVPKNGKWKIVGFSPIRIFNPAL